MINVFIFLEKYCWNHWWETRSLSLLAHYKFIKVIIFTNSHDTAYHIFASVLDFCTIYCPPMKTLNFGKHLLLSLIQTSWLAHIGFVSRRGSPIFYKNRFPYKSDKNFIFLDGPEISGQRRELENLKKYGWLDMLDIMDFIL